MLPARKGVGLLVNSSTPQVKNIPGILEKMHKAFPGRRLDIAVAYGPAPLEKEDHPNGIILLNKPCPQGKGVLLGFDALLSQTASSSLVYSNLDDLPMILGGLPELVSRTGQKIVVARWEEKTAQSIPYAQWISETAISYAITYASPEHPVSVRPSWRDREKFESDSKSAGTLVSAYLGLSGLPAQAWKEVRKAIDFLFVDSMPGNFEKAGVDAGIILAAQKVGLELDNSLSLPVECGHSTPATLGDERKFIESRIRHFWMEMNVVLEFARKISSNKLGPLSLFIEEIVDAISDSSFHWPDGRKITPGKYSTGEESSFMK